MNIPPVGTPALPQAPSGAPMTLSLIGGDPGRLQVGQTLQVSARPLTSDPRLLQLDLAGTSGLLVASNVPLDAGQGLILRVRSLQPQVLFDAAPQAPALSPTAAGLAQPSALTPSLTGAFQPGQNLTVQVLGESVANPGRLVVAINGAEVEAATPEPYPAGSMLRVEVVRATPELVLRALQPPTVDVGLSSALLRERLPAAPLGDVIAPLLAQGPSMTEGSSTTHLQDLVSRLRALIPEGAPPDAGRIEQFIKEGGLHYEAHLARAATAGASGEEVRSVAHNDIKGLALAALAEQSASAPETAGLIQDHLRAIEVLQAANLLAQARGDPVLVQVPVFFPGQQAGTLHLAVQPDGQGRGRDGAATGHSLLLHLDLPGLGGVRVDAHLRTEAGPARGLRATFYAETTTGKSALQAELGSLRDALRGLGQGPVDLAVRDWNQLPNEHLPTFQAMRHGLPRSGSSLDVRA